MEKETRIINWEQDFLCTTRIISAVRRVAFVSNRVSHIVLRGRWCNIVVLNVHVPSVGKSDNLKDGS
jgi:hypothetical protein